MILTDEQLRALKATLEYLKAEEGKSHQGYFYNGWAGLQLRGLFEANKAERYIEEGRDDRTMYDVFSQAFGYSSGFTKADAAAQPKNLTSLEACIRAAIFDVVDSKRYWLYGGANGLTTEEEANAGRTDLADAVVARLRHYAIPNKVVPVPGRVACLQNLPHSIHYIQFDDGTTTAILDESTSAKRDHWEDDPGYPVADWRYEVENNDTRLGYTDWITAKKESERNDRESELSEATKDDDSPAATLHLAAAALWELAPQIPEYELTATARAIATAQEATGRADTATKVAEPNAGAFHFTSAALLAASMNLPAEAAQAHRKAAAAYTDGMGLAEVNGDLSPSQVELLKVLQPDEAQAILEERMETEVDKALRRLKELELIEETR